MSGTASRISLDDCLSEIDVGSFQYKVLCISGAGTAAQAIEIIMLGFVINELRAEWSLTEYEIGGMLTAIRLGEIAGLLVWGQLSDRYGRRAVFLWTSIIVAVFGLLSAFSQSFITFTILRALVAVGIGGSCAVDFAVVSEFAPTEGRIRLLFLTSLMWQFGMVLACSLAWILIPLHGWRSYCIACAIPAVLSAIARPWIPETPRWLLLHGYVKEATDVCSMIAQENGTSLEELELADKQLCLDPDSSTSLLKEEDTANLSSPWKLLTPGVFYTFMGLVAAEASLCVASFAVETFMPTFLAQKGLDGGTSYAVMMATSFANFIGFGLCVALDTCFGRILTLSLSLASLAIALGAFGAITNIGLVACCCMGAAAAVSASYTVLNVYKTEAFPTELRTTAIGAILISADIVGLAFPMINAKLFATAGASVTLFSMSAFVAVGTVFVFCLLSVETQGRALDDRVTTPAIPNARRSNRLQHRPSLLLIGEEATQSRSVGRRLSLTLTGEETSARRFRFSPPTQSRSLRLFSPPSQSRPLSAR